MDYYVYLKRVRAESVLVVDDLYIAETNFKTTINLLVPGRVVSDLVRD